MRLRQYQYSDKLINEYNQVENDRLEHLYDIEPQRKPKEYESVNASIEHIKDRAGAEKKKIYLREQSNRKLNIGDAANIIIENIAMTVIPGDGDEDSANLAVYDYDKQIYVMSYMHLNKYLVAILGSTSRSQIDSLIQTIVSRGEELCYYNPLPKYKIAVGNGIYNCLNNELEEFTPLYTVVTRISTNYVENAQRPQYADGFTLEGMVGDFANNNLDRIQLLSQIIKSILTGVNTSDVFFIVIGPGGDGKSTMFSMITNLIGQQNASFLNFSEISVPEKVLTTLNKKLMLGMDNDVNLYIKKTALLKSMASHENITLQRKYMSSISVEFSPVIVQLCNEMPRFSETKESMRRRIVTFKSENSHYRNGTQNHNIKKYIKDKRFLEYALWYFLNENITPYYNDYNEVDKDVTNESLNNDDVLGQFVDDMLTIGYISDINKIIPLRHLYAVYLDWFNENNPGNKPYGMRTFKLKISEDMDKLGYTFDPYSKHYRPGVIQKEDKYFTHMLGDYKEGREVQIAFDNNNQVKCFERTHEPLVNARERALRSSHVINAPTYFDLTSDLLRFSEKYDLTDEVSLVEHNQPVEQTNLNEIGQNIEIDVFKMLHFGDKEGIEKFIEYIKDDKLTSEELSNTADAILNESNKTGDTLMIVKSKNLIDENEYDSKKEKIIELLTQLKNDL